MRNLGQLFCLILLVGPVNVSADDSLFEAKIRPLLIAHCYKCHSGLKTMGGLSLDTRQGWHKGGDSGPAIVPGNPIDSLLMKAVRHENDSTAMPPEDAGEKITDAEIAWLTEWITLGAQDPREAVQKLAGMSVEDARSWWSFQPLHPTDEDDSPNKIDSFVNAAIVFESLQPNGRADKRTLLRRATYDLIGIPPTPLEMEAFIADDSPDAFSKVIDRMLESPQYGVQWGRHWLDVVRYADTAGENTDRPLPHAWRYRNWVFEAFNLDLAYDQFVRMQIAGDLTNPITFAADNQDGIIATGYLAIARRFGHDIDKDIHLMHEDVIDNLGKNFLGITIGCARCHDHKYDPITAEDYYALYGIFNSTRFAFPGCEPKGQPRDNVPLLSPEQVDELMKPWQALNAKNEAEKKRLVELANVVKKSVNDASANATRMVASGQVDEGQSITINTSSFQVRKGEVLQLVVHPNASHGADTTLVDWKIRETTGDHRQWSVSDLASNLTESNPHDAGHGAVWCFFEEANGPTFLTEKNDAVFGLSAIQSWGLGDTPSVTVNASAQPVNVWTTLQAESFYVHPGPATAVAVAWISPIDGTVEFFSHIADAHLGGGDGVSFTIKHLTATEIGPQLVEIGQNLSYKGPKNEPAPTIPVAYAVAESNPKNVAMQLRGDPEQKGDEVPRRWLSVFGGESVAADGGSGRKQLADWILEQPLTARVMVNRIWQWHFGSGLVRSPNDFGSRGDQPTHPELLDFLASEFVKNGYSIKSMHRLIMNSETYQRSSVRQASFLQSDADNRLLARFSRRRLSAEEIRDSLLFVSGQLDLSPAQSHPFPPEATWAFSQHGPFNAVYESKKSSAYLMVQRQRRHPFLSLFDGADPNASTPIRQATTVPTQALYFLNDPFFHEQALRIAESLSSLPDEHSRLSQLYRVLLQREPSLAEHRQGEIFLLAYPASEPERWAAYVRVMMASNEFIHID